MVLGILRGTDPYDLASSPVTTSEHIAVNPSGERENPWISNVSFIIFL